MSNYKRFVLILMKILVRVLAVGQFCNGHNSPSGALSFYFFCQYDKLSESAFESAITGEIELSVSVDGNPDYYVPGKMYRVLVMSNSDFDGFMMMIALRLTPSNFESKPKANLRDQSGDPSVLCSVIHSYVSQRPLKILSFIWIPPTNAGCVDFLATGSLGQKILFKDITAYHLCDKDSFDANLIEAHTIQSFKDHGVLFREDFENVALNTSLWGKHIGVTLANVVGHTPKNRMANFCEHFGERILETSPLNTSSSTHLQFSVATTNCESGNPNITLKGNFSAQARLLVGIKNCTFWIEILNFSVPSERCNEVVHLVPLPANTRSEDVCFQWLQTTTDNSSCWALNDVLVDDSSTFMPSLLWETFDPFDPGNWLFFPGGKITRYCHSEGNAIVFRSRHTSSAINYATTRRLLVAQAEDEANLTAGALFRENFDDTATVSTDWIISGGKIGQNCNVVHHKKAVVLMWPIKPNGNQSLPLPEILLCSPYLNATKAGIVSFYLSGGCTWNDSDNIQNRDQQISVYSEFPGGQTTVLKNVSLADYQTPRRVVAALPLLCQAPKVRFCVREINEGTNNSFGVWSVDSFMILPWLSERIVHVIQFKVSAQCSTGPISKFKSNTTSLTIDFSNDHGLSWTPLHTPCLPPYCRNSQSLLDSRIWLDHLAGFRRVTLPLPVAALLTATMFRFHQTGSSRQALTWAIDDVFIGRCSQGCHGHGQCLSDGCRCDPGFKGRSCDVPVVENHLSFSQDFSSVTSILYEHSGLKISGAVLGYQCGVLDRSKGLVFNLNGPRSLTTPELNTTAARFLEFAMRLGNSDTGGQCISPDEPSEGLYVHSSCNGGMGWLLLDYFLPSPFYRRTRHVVVSLPEVAKGSSCQFRIGQAMHSGDSLDVWAIDSLSIGPVLKNTFSVDFNDERSIELIHDGVLGSYCDHDGAVKFINSGSKQQFLQTSILAVGPMHMMQFDLVLDCEVGSKSHYQVSLVYSKDQGMTWNLVIVPCIPPATDCGALYTGGTVYDSSEYIFWKRVTLKLPSETWSDATIFRLVRKQVDNSSTTWAVDNLYVGPACPDLCSGHGQCTDGTCRCDLGFSGVSCLPSVNSSDRLKINSTSLKQLADIGVHVLGGDYVGAVFGGRDECGVVASESSVYFYKRGIRELVTPDVDTGEAEVLEFFLQTMANPNETDSTKLVLQFSNDAGFTWQLLKELPWRHYYFPQYELTSLPMIARTQCTRMRFWQPNHSGENLDQWVVDKIEIAQRQLFRSVPTISDDGQSNFTLPVIASTFSFHTRANLRGYCLSDDIALVFEEVERFRFAITKEIFVRKGDVIQFKISVGCTDTFSWIGAVRLDFSHDGGRSWTLVRRAVYPGMSFHLFDEASIYYSGIHGRWSLVVIAVTEEIAARKTMFRWSQHISANESLVTGSFALTNVYIGRPCPDWCSGSGVCFNGLCHCNKGFQGPNCVPEDANPNHMHDNFDTSNLQDGSNWRHVYGGLLDTACGSLGVGRSLVFGGDGFREASTIDLDTRNIRFVQFLFRICYSNHFQPMWPEESVLLQYSVNGGLSWSPLHYFDSLSLVAHRAANSTGPIVLSIRLPKPSRSASTCFRWWQPLGRESAPEPGYSRVTWALDNLEIGDYDTDLATGLWENFTDLVTDHWFSISRAVVQPACGGDENVLFFDRSSGSQFVETVEFEVSSGDFLQFRLSLGCNRIRKRLPLIERDEKDARESMSIVIDYSIDSRHSWHLLQEECSPADARCYEYRQPSVFNYSADVSGQWIRVSIPLPSRAISPNTRFRWHRSPILGITNSSLSWALDDVYLGHECSWMCSGHGVCRNGQCACDVGFNGPHCVSDTVLPNELRESFDDALAVTESGSWKVIRGATIGAECGLLSSGLALVFINRGLRLASTADLDLTRATEIQFDMRFGCGETAEDFKQTVTDLGWRRRHSVVLQYSNNGGISWHLLLEAPYNKDQGLKKYMVNLLLHPPALTNATRLRLWQPSSKELSALLWSWAIDNLFVGGDATPLSILNENFEDETVGGPRSHLWIGWPGATISSYCSNSDHQRVMLFINITGERSACTKDVQMGINYVMQFDINVGCGGLPTGRHPVKLEYSVDRGVTWKLVRNYLDINDSSGQNFWNADLASVYHNNGHREWTLVTIPLDHLSFFGLARFRWSQGHVSKNVDADWGIDNIYVGPSCPNHCSGYGRCQNGLACHCDTGYGGSDCSSQLAFQPCAILESFDESKRDRANRRYSNGRDDLIEDSQLYLISGARVSEECGILFSGFSLYFDRPGDRYLVTRELNLTLARHISFYLRMNCKRTSSDHNKEIESWDPVFPLCLQYSKDGGIFWHTVAELPFPDKSGTHFSSHVVMEVPDDARSTGIRLRWWQPSCDGIFLRNWAIDQISVGGKCNNVEFVEDGFLGDDRSWNWEFVSGEIMQTVCERQTNALHFVEGSIQRYAETTDVAIITRHAFVHFELSMGCSDFLKCYEVELHYSLDGGRHWQLLIPGCLPYDPQCLDQQSPSIYRSDIYNNPTFVSFLLPDYAKSKSTRFRWSQNPGFDLRDTWGLSSVYIGSGCQEACSGRGKCETDRCRCNDGWTGVNCDRPKTSLPTGFTDRFIDGIVAEHWQLVRGAVVSTICGSVGSKSALHFYGGCSRLAQTVPLDLRDSSFLRFGFRFGCVRPPSSPEQNVLLQYTSNGGVQWTTLIILQHDQHLTSGSSMTVVLPPEARAIGVQLRWWQPQHDGPAVSDWAIHSVTVGSGYVIAERIRSTSGGSIDLDDVQGQRTNIRLDHYCGSNKPAMLGRSSTDEDSFVETADVLVASGDVLEFKIAVGCDILAGGEGQSVSPVHVEMSFDQGLSWMAVTSIRAPRAGIDLDGGGGPGSYYEATTGWRRVVLTIEEDAALRFRWIQRTQPGSTEWGLIDARVGPSCLNHCSGHGTCLSPPRCVCDSHFHGDDCSQSDLFMNQLHDHFDAPVLNISRWTLNLGGRVASVHGLSGALVFDKCGSRLIETVDLNLHQAKFVKFIFVTIDPCLGIAGRVGKLGDEENIFVQYSCDAGITWTTVRKIIIAGKVIASWENIILPADARKVNIRFRWWQVHTPSCNGADLTNDEKRNCSHQSPLSFGWAISNVLIGGSQINPSIFYESFDSGIAQAESWWPQSSGKVKNTFCGRNTSNSFVVFSVEDAHNNSAYSGLTTRELIIGENYVLQFKLIVGCEQGDHENETTVCGYTKPEIALEFTTNPSTPNSWDKLIPPCQLFGDFLADESVCSQNEFGQPSVYSAETLSGFTRISLEIPKKAMSSETQFRWRPTTTIKTSFWWAIDNVFIGEGCPELCSGRGDCSSDGGCHCDAGAIDGSCSGVTSALMPDTIFESFDYRLNARKWKVVVGGHIGSDCGNLSPWGQGNHLHFDGCGVRLAVTSDLNLRQTKALSFVLRMGSMVNSSKCSSTWNRSSNSAVLLQFSQDNGLHWKTLATHHSKNFVLPRKLMYDIPKEARLFGIQIRWWQSRHEKGSYDHWALDNVEFVQIITTSRLRPPYATGQLH